MQDLFANCVPKVHLHNAFTMLIIFSFQFYVCVTVIVLATVLDERFAKKKPLVTARGAASPTPARRTVGGGEVGSVRGWLLVAEGAGWRRGRGGW